MRGLVIYMSLFLAALNASGQQDIDLLLIARNTGIKQLADSTNIRVFGFAKTLSAQPNVPGPTLTANEGDSVHIDLWNVSQGAPHTIHLHGLDVDQQNDGVPHLSFDVGHMKHGFYHFKAPHAGTYLYHCHVASTIHVQAGMYGLIIIKPKDGSNTTWTGGYSYSQESSFLLSEIDTTWHKDSVLLHDHDTSTAIHQIKIPSFDPQYFLINGFSDQQLISEKTEFNSKANQTDYIRLANIGFCGNRVIFPPGLNARIISSDGRPLPEAEISDTVYLYPGERYGVITKPVSEFVGVIKFDYVDLNTNRLKNSQYVPVNIVGNAAVNKTRQPDFSFKIVPNPNRGEGARLEMAFDQSVNLKVVIYNVFGQLVHETLSQQFDPGLNKINLSHLQVSPGNYFVHLFSDDGRIAIQKMVVL
jgi:FtsP/CotA-like multicopper oxidase with cupredoxin domain